MQQRHITVRRTSLPEAPLRLTPGFYKHLEQAEEFLPSGLLGPVHHEWRLDPVKSLSTTVKRPMCFSFFHAFLWPVLCYHVVTLINFQVENQYCIPGRPALGHSALLFLYIAGFHLLMFC